MKNMGRKLMGETGRSSSTLNGVRKASSKRAGSFYRIAKLSLQTESHFRKIKAPRYKHYSGKKKAKNVKLLNLKDDKIRIIADIS